MNNSFDKSKKYFESGLCLLQLKSFAEAEVAFKESNLLTPNRVSVLLNLSTCLIEQGKWAEAYKFISLMLKEAPKDQDGLLNLGIYQAHTGLTMEALTTFNEVLSVNPKNVKALINQGNTLQDIFQHHRALDCFNTALEIDPFSVEALIGRGNVKNFFKYYEAALKDFDTAINLEPQNPKANTNKGMALIRLGDFKNGWKLFEYRWGIHDIKRYGWQTNVPTWRGEDGTNKSILVLSEQGFGDNIQFSRYLPLLIEQYKFKVYFYSPKALFNLMHTLHPKINVLSSLDHMPKNIDYQIPIMSLPLLFGTELGTIPAVVPYFLIPSETSLKWRKKIIQLEKGKSTASNKHIGLCWRGSGKYAGQKNTRRDLDYDSLKILTSQIKKQNIQLHSLQVDLSFQEIKIASELGLHVHQSDLGDFLATAQLISELDAIISIDTAVGHLSGALNKPTYLLLPDPPDFMSLIDRMDTPWYPNAKLLRQDSPGNWLSAIGKINLFL